MLKIFHLSVRTVLLEGEAEVVEDAALGGDALGVSGPVTQPGEGLVTFVTHLVTIVTLRVTRLLTLAQTLELHQDGGGHPELPVPGLRELLDLGQVVHQDIRVRDQGLGPGKCLSIVIVVIVVVVSVLLLLL